MKNTSKKTYKIISILFIVMILLGGVDTLFNIFLNNDIKLNSILITITGIAMYLLTRTKLKS
ncbi:putative membrane protein [Bacillus thuringiensis]|nr:hypothetical protein bcf_25820 [Bacillus cereus F837/76]AJH69286.1 putative membrane protein [Bacillus thuringiensis]PYD98502.1 hypothetical protein CR195_009540 [Bacillus cereus]HDR4408452.1 hypothetical protein [Bacillus cereus]